MTHSVTSVIECPNQVIVLEIVYACLHLFGIESRQRRLKLLSNWVTNLQSEHSALVGNILLLIQSMYYTIQGP